MLICSTLVVKELRNVGFSDFEIHEMLSVVKPDHIKMVHPTKEQAEEARNLSKQRGIPFGDAFHAILARDYEAQLVSRDRHFEKVKDITETKSPTDLI